MMSKGTLDRDLFEAIEAYVMGTMPTPQRDRFEQELAANHDLRAEVELQRTNIRAVEIGGMDRLLKDLAREERSSTPGAAGWTHYLKYAAAVVLLLGVAIWAFTRPTPNERLFATHYIADPGLPVAMGATDDHAFQDAMVAYKLGDFREARGTWTVLLQAAPQNDTLRYYIASADLAMGDVPAAIPALEDLAKGHSAFAAKARWYLFLAYIKADETEKARSVALDDDPVYGERIRAIKTKL